EGKCEEAKHGREFAPEVREAPQHTVISLLLEWREEGHAVALHDAFDFTAGEQFVDGIIQELLHLALTPRHRDADIPPYPWLRNVARERMKPTVGILTARLWQGGGPDQCGLQFALGHGPDNLSITEEQSTLIPIVKQVRISRGGHRHPDLRVLQVGQTRRAGRPTLHHPDVAEPQVRPGKHEFLLFHLLLSFWPGGKPHEKIALLAHDRGAQSTPEPTARPCVGPKVVGL